jgi:hypothetical protein
MFAHLRMSHTQVHQVLTAAAACGVLQAAHAEVVMTFEGINELGDTFMTRRSYLPSEMHWGCMFVNIVHRAQEGRTQHTVDLSRSAPGLLLHPSSSCDCFRLVRCRKPLLGHTYCSSQLGCVH